MEEKINHLEQAIAYVNYEHCKLFTMQLTCIRRPVITIQLCLCQNQKKTGGIPNDGRQYPELRAHLEQSCARLLEAIINRLIM